MFGSPGAQLANPARRSLLKGYALIFFPAVFAGAYPFVLFELLAGHGRFGPGLLLFAVEILLPLDAILTVLAGSYARSHAPTELYLFADELHYSGYRWVRGAPRRLSLILPLRAIRRVGKPTFGGYPLTGRASVETAAERSEGWIRDQVIVARSVLDRLGLEPNQRYVAGRSLRSLLPSDSPTAPADPPDRR